MGVIMGHLAQYSTNECNMSLIYHLCFIITHITLIYTILRRVT